MGPGSGITPNQPVNRVAGPLARTAVDAGAIILPARLDCPAVRTRVVARARRILCCTGILSLCTGGRRLWSGTLVAVFGADGDCLLREPWVSAQNAPCRC